MNKQYCSYKERKNCIFCNFSKFKLFFKKDSWTFAAHFPQENKEKNFILPFNVLICKKCFTPQNKYLASIEEVYKKNHADSTGLIMENLHNKVFKIIKTNKSSIKNIIEIGSAKGVLADLVLKEYKLKYFIIEPNFIGNPTNKIIINNFYENVKDEELEADTIIMSHVFEHFYEPMEIVNKISKNKKIENIILVFPDLEYYSKNNIAHVLNSEHTFYASNKFITQVFKSKGFKLKQKEKYLNHSVIFYFQRSKENIKKTKLKNSAVNLNKYFKNIKNTVFKFNQVIKRNKNKNIFLFPASVHSSYLFQFNLNHRELAGLLDNSSNKIGKELYGTNLKIFSFKETISKDNNNLLILMNGGLFNKEVTKSLKNNKINYYIYNLCK